MNNQIFTRVCFFSFCFVCYELFFGRSSCFRMPQFFLTMPASEYSTATRLKHSFSLLFATKKYVIKLSFCYFFPQKSNTKSHYALNIRFCNFLAVKSYAKSCSVNLFRVHSSKIPKMNATHF